VIDPHIKWRLRSQLKALHRQFARTMVYVTHDQTEAMTMADQVVLMRNGRIEQSGTPEDLYTRPASAFTASFIGAPPMNLLKRDGGMLGVRPEDMRLEGGGALEATVDSIEYLGADSLVAATAEAQPVLVRVPGRAAVRAGEKVRIAWDSQHEHRFDHNGGRL